MSIVSQIVAALSAWMDTTSAVLGAKLTSVKTSRRIEAVEAESGGFSIRLTTRTGNGEGGLPPCSVDLTEGSIQPALSQQWIDAMRGATVELRLLPSRFVFRPLELPNRALEFLDGIIKAQIDRLTPWSASEALFHWTSPQDVGDRIELMVVATSRAAVTSLAQSFSDMGAAGVEVSTRMSEQEWVTVLSERAGGQASGGRMRFALVATLAITGLLAFLCIGLGGMVADSYDGQQQQVQRRIAERRAVLNGNQPGGSSPLELLIRRKQTTPSSVIVIEALCRLLPQDTYATQIRIEGDKLQIVGITRDAPALIQILEQSPHFSSAGFFAPTTRGTNDPGDRFHIEAKMKPYFRLGA